MVEYVLFAASGLILGSVVTSWYCKIMKERENQIKEVNDRIDSVCSMINQVDENLRREIKDQLHTVEHILEEHAGAINTTAEHVESIEPRVKGFSK